MQFSAKQISGNTEHAQPTLAVLVKQTFVFDNKGQCTPADNAEPLVDKIAYYEHNDQLLKDDSDLFVFKKYCDVIIKGKARNFGNEKKFYAGVQIGNTQFDILVQGNRKAYFNSFGKLEFSEPEIILEVPLRYDYAYGGKDTEAEKKMQLPNEEIMAAMPEQNWYADSPFRYPRNPEGKGFIVEPSKAMIEKLELPNLEDPTQQLTPGNIITNDVNRWVEMPLPFATDWVNHVWAPRLLYTGLVEFPYPNPRALKEIKMKWVEPDLYDHKQFNTGFNYRFFNGGHFGLQINPLKIPDDCTLLNIHPTQKRITLKLPKAWPKIWTDGRKGTLKETQTLLHSIHISPDENKVNIIWRGASKALRPYHPLELNEMPFKVEW
ncbi:MAG: DUF2169 domain-containing protein [Chitinophagaceae bacterium]|nr:DUF2169 domain-containing protein [Bacteroidota bacterium]MCC6257494.1 DUF2169 domain-containing protein [Chitinophagaceae bacterium]MCW5916234.1 DUF2169 domain-containing protein [Ferruginibacter sp.]